MQEMRRASIITLVLCLLTGPAPSVAERTIALT